MDSLLPYNSTALEFAAERAIREGLDTDVPIDRLWSAQDCPVDLLPILAWALSVDYWDADWPENIKRQVIAASVFVHKHKGTRAALDKALDALDLGVSISEWFEHGGQPYTFRADVYVSTRGITAREVKNILATIAATKNARSYLARLRVYLSSNLRPVKVFIAAMAVPLTALPWLPELGNYSAAPGTAIAAHLVQPITAQAYL